MFDLFHLKNSKLHQNDSSVSAGNLNTEITADQYMKVFQVYPDAVAIAEIESGKFIEVNDGFTRLFGFTRQESIGKTVLDLGIYQNLKDREAFVKLARTKTRLNSYPMKMKDRTGKKLEVILTSEILKIGQTDCFIVIAHDVTVLNEDEEKLKLTQYTVEHTQNTIFWVNPEGKIIYANETATQTFGYSQTELLQMILLDIEVNITAELFKKQLLALKDKGHISFETAIRAKNGAVIPVEVSVDLIDYNGKSIQIATIHDIAKRKEMEKNLKQSHDFLENIINNVSSPIFVKDQKHNWMVMNDAMCLFIGHKKEDTIGKSDYDFFPKDQADIFWAKDEEVFRKGELNINEEFITDANNVKHTIVTRKNLFTDKNGNKFLVGIINDITELRTQEIELKNTADRLKILFENAPAAFYIHDMNGVILDGNKQIEDLLNIKKVELIGKNFAQINILPSSSVEKALVNLAKIKLGTPMVEFEMDFTPRDKPLITCSINAYGIVLEGKKVVFGSIRDLTKQIKSQKALNEQEAMLRQIIDTTDAGIFIRDNTSKYLMVNKAFARLNGDKPENIVGMTDADFVKIGRYTLDDAKRIQSDEEKVWKNHETINIKEEKVTRKNGEVQWFQTVKAPIEFNSHGTCILGVILDITDRKMAEEKLINQNEELSRLNKLMVGREVRMSDLKIEIEQLKNQQKVSAKI
jgi:PAS domain S-box-containing protein